MSKHRNHNEGPTLAAVLIVWCVTFVACWLIAAVIGALAWAGIRALSDLVPWVTIGAAAISLPIAAFLATRAGE